MEEDQKRRNILYAPYLSNRFNNQKCRTVLSLALINIHRSQNY